MKTGILLVLCVIYRFRCAFFKGSEITPSKTSKPSTSAPEPATIPSYPDWSNSMQAYYGGAPTAPPFFASTVASPAPYGYLLGGQHAFPPYGTPMPYQAIFPPSGVYAHHAVTSVPNTKFEAKTSDVKEKTSSKKTSASKMVENGETASGSGNDAVSHSGEIGSEGSSNASDGNTRQESTSAKNGKPEQNHSEANTSIQTWKALPATNLNIGMDLWNSSSKIKGNPSQVIPDLWIPDERELKRQKRKQSNRESARRSRLRKQAECEELQARVQTLSNENRSLRDELKKLADECESIKMENDTIKDELTRVRGPDASANLELGNSSP